MSKRWNLSQQIQGGKDNFEAPIQDEDSADSAFVTYQEQRRTQQRRAVSVTKIFFTLIFLSLVGLNVQLFLLAQKYVLKIDTIGTKIDDVQRSIALNKTEIAGVSRGMLSLKSKQEVFESEFVDIKDKVIALSEQAAKPAELASVERRFKALSDKIAALTRSDAMQREMIETLRKKKDRLVRRFALYDVELKRMSKSRGEGL